MANYQHIQIRRDTTENWAANDPVLWLGEIGADMDLHRLKVGDGVRKWSELSWFDPEIIDNLTSTKTDAGLSAAQGKALRDLINDVANGGVTVVNNLNSTSTTAALSANQGRELKRLIDNLPEPSVEVDVVDNLNSTSATAALSANQGRELKRQLDEVANGGVTVVDNLTSTSATSALSANQGRVLSDKIDGVSGELDGKIERLGLFGMGYEVTETNSQSKPTKIKFKDGVTCNLTWSGTQLQKITASTGEVMTINYNVRGTIIGRTITRS